VDAAPRRWPPGLPPLLFLGRNALTERGLRAASRIAVATGPGCCRDVPGPDGRRRRAARGAPAAVLPEAADQALAGTAS